MLLGHPRDVEPRRLLLLGVLGDRERRGGHVGEAPAGARRDEDRGALARDPRLLRVVREPVPEVELGQHGRLAGRVEGRVLGRLVAERGLGGVVADESPVELERVDRLLGVEVRDLGPVVEPLEPRAAVIEEVGGEARGGEPPVAAREEPVDLGLPVAVLVDGELLRRVLELGQCRRDLDVVLLEEVLADVEGLGLGRPHDVVERLAGDDLGGVETAAEPVSRVVIVGRGEGRVVEVGLQILEVPGGGELPAPVVHLQHDDVELRVLAGQHDVLLLADLARLKHLHLNLDSGLFLEALRHRAEPGVDVVRREVGGVEGRALELTPVDLGPGGGGGEERGHAGRGQDPEYVHLNLPQLPGPLSGGSEPRPVSFGERSKASS